MTVRSCISLSRGRMLRVPRARMGWTFTPICEVTQRSHCHKSAHRNIFILYTFNNSLQWGVGLGKGGEKVGILGR